MRERERKQRKRKGWGRGGVLDREVDGKRKGGQERGEETEMAREGKT